jgi:hypothetical protein
LKVSISEIRNQPNRIWNFFAQNEYNIL